MNRSKEIDDKFRQMTLINRQLIHRIKELETKTNSNTSINNINSNNNNIQEMNKNTENIKQEPQINIINLINSNSFDNTDFVINNNSNNKIAKNHLSINQPFLKKQMTPDMPPDEQQSVYLNETTGSILNEAKLLDEILNSPIQDKQNDPFLGHSKFSNIYDENIMDSFN